MSHKSTLLVSYDYGAAKSMLAWSTTQNSNFESYFFGPARDALKTSILNYQLVEELDFDLYDRAIVGISTAGIFEQRFLDQAFGKLDLICFIDGWMDVVEYFDDRYNEIWLPHQLLIDFYRAKKPSNVYKAYEDVLLRQTIDTASKFHSEEPTYLFLTQPLPNQERHIDRFLELVPKNAHKLIKIHPADDETYRSQFDGEILDSKSSLAEAIGRATTVVSFSSTGLVFAALANKEAIAFCSEQAAPIFRKVGVRFL